ncbi:MAG: transcription termination/antitermination protein NusA [Parcubacteria group bacterium]|nr:transcription termination/antitermination protein NusA [Parcubacteria group bacterium]
MIDLKLLNPLIRQISEDRGLPEEKILEAVEAALAAAYKKEYGKKAQIVKAKINPETGETKFWQVKIVVDPSEILNPEEEAEEIAENNENKKIKFNPEKHILLEEALKINSKIKPGEEIIYPLEVKEDFSRIAAQTAKQVILQKLHELEKETIISEFKDKEEKVVSGTIQRIEKKVIYVDLGKTFGVLFPNEGIPGEHYKIGERKKFYVLRLEDKGHGPVIILSRAHPKFVSKLFETEVPEIAEGVVEIKSISREPGNRTKIAVSSNEENIDPVGSCVGQKGTRVATIIDELNGERIDIIPFSEEPAKYVADALGPAQVKETEVIPERREVRVFVPPEQISLAIGKNGQNVRLAAKLTGWKIDVRSAIAPEEIIEGGTAEAEANEKQEGSNNLDNINEEQD